MNPQRLEFTLTKQNQGDEPFLTNPCTQPYVPSKLEWLTLTMNAERREDCQDPLLGSFSLQYDCRPPNSILIQIFAGAATQVSREYLTCLVKTSQVLIEAEAKRLGILDSIEIKVMVFTI